MPLRLRCPDCRASVLVPERLLGCMVRCPKCRLTFEAPDEDAVPRIQSAPTDDAPARPSPSAPAVRPLRRPDRAPGRLGLIFGVAAAALFLVLLGVGVGAAGILWLRLSAGPAPASAGPIVVSNDRKGETPVVVHPLPAPAAPVAPPAPAQPAAPVAPRAAPPAVPAVPHDAAPFHLAEARKSVVFIRRSAPGHPTAVGSGFLVSKDGLVATNRHVIQPAAGPAPGTLLVVGVPSAADPNVLDYFKAEVALCSPPEDTLDFALLKIAAKPDYPAFRPLPLAAAKLDLGDPAAAVGFPFVAVNQPVLSFNKGSISAARVEFEGRPFYQTDAAVNPGNSGGPLVNADGEVVGVVTLKMANANNMGYALYLGETGMPAALNQERFARLQPEAGPLDPKRLPASAALTAPHKADWQVVRGEAREEKGALVVDNQGGEYWLTSKDALPENFELMIQCEVEPLVAGQVLRGMQRMMVRSLYVRFGTDATDEDIRLMGGTTVHLCAGLLHLAEAGDMVVGERKAIPDGPFLLTLTRRGDELSVAVDGEVWLKQALKHPSKGAHKFSIGGFVSRLSLGAVSVLPVDGPPVAKAEPPKVDAPKPEAKPEENPPANRDGPLWTMDLDKMKVPDAPVSGNVLGVAMRVNEASLNKLTGWLMLREGNGRGPGASVLIMGPGKSLQEIEGKTYDVPAVRRPGAAWYFVHLGAQKGNEKARLKIFGDGYAMRLEFGKVEDGKLTGKIYICFSDEDKSVVAGTFVLEDK